MKKFMKIFTKKLPKSYIKNSINQYSTRLIFLNLGFGNFFMNIFVTFKLSAFNRVPDLLAVRLQDVHGGVELFHLLEGVGRVPRRARPHRLGRAVVLAVALEAGGLLDALGQAGVPAEVPLDGPLQLQDPQIVLGDSLLQFLY